METEGRPRKEKQNKQSDLSVPVTDGPPSKLEGGAILS